MPRPVKKSVRAKIREYDAANLACARIIWGERERYGGDGSLMVEWARVIIGKSESVMRNLKPTGACSVPVGFEFSR